MTSMEMTKRLVKWAVTDVYNRWETFALKASITAYEYASARAGEESDARKALVKEFVETMVKAEDLEREEAFKDLIVYTPRDWR